MAKITLTDAQEKDVEELVADMHADPLMYAEVTEEYIWMRDQLNAFRLLLEVAK